MIKLSICLYINIKRKRKFDRPIFATFPILYNFKPNKNI
ncbi:hypothetical protein LBBP_02316 [Leptospira borgpetersenii serovar Ballum]|uniref:Uncharacterized protein n=1 Tax=Leptospira borgpetersenii serovar Ballum TaxID=280505 RepID=A0A0S2ISS8_LEPBO|nr:hypothetical protein LBBP_02316 [Leptospira borgpetersenii serovar Ballum]